MQDENYVSRTTDQLFTLIACLLFMNKKVINYLILCKRLENKIPLWNYNWLKKVLKWLFNFYSCSFFHLISFNSSFVLIYQKIIPSREFNPEINETCGGILLWKHTGDKNIKNETKEWQKWNKFKNHLLESFKSCLRFGKLFVRAIKEMVTLKILSDKLFS